MLKAFDKIRDTKLRPVDINAPGNGFDRGIVKAYNDCRRKYLRKYLDGLSDEQINKLLRDNYIFKTNIESLLK